jgi:NAD(P)-dependent dehydrogenase (short-subunit alcohol dehydrogenase family)
MGDNEMAKHIALITGGMGGLGESISTKMHDAGFNVVVTHSPGNKNAAAWVADYKGRGYNFAAFGVDVADYDSCQACLAKVRGGEEGRDGQHHLAGLHRNQDGDGNSERGTRFQDSAADSP